MKKDCILYRQTRNEKTGEIKNEFCILNEKAQSEMERTEKCGTYECPFYKESEDELRTIEEDKKRFAQRR